MSVKAAKTRPPSFRAVADAGLLDVIRQVHADNYGVYGVRKMHTELNPRGHRIAMCIVHRLMRGDGLRGIRGLLHELVTDAPIGQEFPGWLRSVRLAGRGDRS